MSDAFRDRLQASLGSAYTLDRELGGGGMSRVFVARDEALGREVVVKVLAPELAEGLSAERFAREIRFAAALQAPHIVPVHAAGTTADGLPYYTMPFVAGQSLRARLNAGPLPLDEALGVLRDVATALEYAHARGVVHRDIKPENVLLSGRTAVVTDFGIAKAISMARVVGDAGEPITQSGMSMGTPAYMAPEQAAGDPTTDYRADLYAWGVVAYESLAARHPFAPRASAQALITAHFVEVPASLSLGRPHIPARVAAVVMQCLQKDRDLRPRSASDLLAALVATSSAPQPFAPAPTPDAEPLRVLIVDDESLARRRVADLLMEQEGVRIVGTASSGAEAVAAIRALTPDVVFLDVQMPGGTGLEVVREIGPGAMPVTVFVTAYDQYALRAFDAAAIDYIVKPFDDERFEQAFRRARRAVKEGAATRLSEQLFAALQTAQRAGSGVIVPADPAADGPPVR
jgi:serine/threonine protein kinase